MADAPKPAAPAAPISESSLFIRNPSGGIYDVDELNAAGMRNPAVSDAAKRANGWRFATADEIKAYAVTHNLEAPDVKAIKARHDAVTKSLLDPAAAAEVEENAGEQQAGDQQPEPEPAKSAAPAKK